MIIVRLIGGLGNQMFQYALGRRLAMDRCVALKLDLSWFQTQTLRSYQLDVFNISAEIALPDDIEKLTRAKWGGLKGRIHHAVEGRIPYYWQRVVMEQVPFFDPNIVKKVSRNAYLSGYWQSEKYFKNIEEILQQDLAFKYPPDRSNENLLQLIADTESISFHIRRGDYVSNPVANQILGVCSNEYYQNCIQIIADKMTDPYFFVFSDDIQWAKSNLQIGYPVMFVEHNDINKGYEDFRLMQTCKHHIIANSSFSWWTAWLSSYSSKIVMAPQRWFKDTSYDDRDLIPNSWMRV